MLLTGRMDSKNWCMSHLYPLTQTPNVSELLLVLDGKIETGCRTRQFAVPGSLGWIKPRAIIRSIWAVRIALKEKPDIIMSYSFFPPGVFGLLAGRLTGAPAIVQLAGGPKEIESGGISSDIPLVPEFMRRGLVPLCRRLCSQFDAVIVRGRKGADYVRGHSTPGHIEIIPGSVNSARFTSPQFPRVIDIVFVGRIVPIKQPDHVCEVIRRVAQRRKGLRAVIAGRGPLLPTMKRQACDCGLQNIVRFAGHVERIEGLLNRSRIFLLTSESEGLSIALAEAMMAGAVPVVADVGDLGELVINGETGWLIEPGNFEAYAGKITALLEDEQLWAQMSRNARELAMRNNGVDSVVRRWQKLLGEMSAPRAPAPSAPDLCAMSS